jgi:hypothetical protein
MLKELIQLFGLSIGPCTTFIWVMPICLKSLNYSGANIVKNLCNLRQYMGKSLKFWLRQDQCLCNLCRIKFIMPCPWPNVIKLLYSHNYGTVSIPLFKMTKNTALVVQIKPKFFLHRAQEVANWGPFTCLNAQCVLFYIGLSWATENGSDSNFTNRCILSGQGEHRECRNSPKIERVNDW